MSDEHHKWLVGSALPEIRPHSAAKHRVIAQYLSRYVDVLTANPLIPELCLTLVDGFSGGGLYWDPDTQAERYGSPLLMLQAMREAAITAQLKRSKEFKLDVEYFFVESSNDTFAFLKASLEQSDFRALLAADKIHLVNEPFLGQIDRIISHVKRRGRGNRAIFVLDQCGYGEVPFPAIRSILSQIGKAEIILTFATDWLIDYLAGQDSMQKTLERVGLELGKDQILSAKQQTDWRRAIQCLLHSEIYTKSGATYYTPFFIRSKEAHRDYWLIHLSNHARARDVMVGLHWSENTSFAHFGRPGLSMLGYDQDNDVKITGQPYLFDDSARKLTHESLMDQLPERLFEFKDGIMFADFFSRLTNETPATMEIMGMVVAMMQREGMIDIRDKTGLVKRQAGIQRPTDVIKPSPQGRLIFLGE
jgi:three-Cys-motif partner protein